MQLAWYVIYMCLGKSLGCDLIILVIIEITLDYQVLSF